MRQRFESIELLRYPRKVSAKLLLESAASRWRMELDQCLSNRRIKLSSHAFAWPHSHMDAVLPTDMLTYFVDRTDSFPATEVARIVMEQRAKAIMVLSLSELPITTKTWHFPLSVDGKKGDIWLPTLPSDNAAVTSKSMLQFHQVYDFTASMIDQVVDNVISRRDDTT